MKHDMLAVTRCRQKTAEFPSTAYSLFDKPLSHCTKSYRLHCGLDLPCLPCFLNVRLMLKSHIQRWQSSWGVTQGIKLGDTGSQNKLIGNVAHIPRWQKCR